MVRYKIVFENGYSSSSTRAAAGEDSEKIARYKDEDNAAGCDFYPLVVETLGVSEKIARYEDEDNAAGCDFYPLVVETLGVWSPSSLETLKIIARRTVLTTETTVSKGFQHLLQQLSFSLWRYNAKLILDRLAICNVDNVMWEYV